MLRHLVAAQRMGDDDNALLVLSPSSQIKLVDSDNGFNNTEEKVPIVPSDNRVVNAEVLSYIKL